MHLHQTPAPEAAKTARCCGVERVRAVERSHVAAYSAAVCVRRPSKRCRRYDADGAEGRATRPSRSCWRGPGWRGGRKLRRCANASPRRKGGGEKGETFPQRLQIGHAVGVGAPAAVGGAATAVRSSAVGAAVVSGGAGPGRKAKRGHAIRIVSDNLAPPPPRL